jgi:O-antigen/teichoic acid export membrane protein
VTLKARAISAGRWTTLANVTRVVLQFLQTIVLARLLVPGDFGTMALVGSVIAIAWVFADFGLSNAIIHFDKPDSQTLSTLYWLNIAVGFVLMLIFILLAWPVADLYQNASLVYIFFCVSLIFPINALSLQFRLLAEKELRFLPLAWIDIASALLSFIAAVLSALLGMGVYALVAGLLVLTISRSLLSLLFLSGGNLPRFCFNITGIGKFVRYGLYRMGETLANAVGSQADILTGGYFLGPGNLGTYAVPRDLSLQIANAAINPVVTRVGTPLMVKLNHDLPGLRSVYLLMLRMSSSINFPIYIFLGFFAQDIVYLLWGSQWAGAGLYLQIFAMWGAIRSVGNPVGSLLYATGRVRLAFFWNLTIVFCVIPVLVFGIFLGGQEGLAIGMLTFQLLIFFPIWKYLVKPACGASFSEYIAQLIPPLVAAVLAAAVAYALLFGSGLSAPLLRIMLALVSGGLTYIGISLVINRSWISTMRDIIR